MSKSHDQIAHAWANQTHENLKGCNVFFEGDTIFSYGRHFPIARLVTGEEFAKPLKDARPIVLFTSKEYSVSTAKHKSIVQRACNQFRTFTVPNVSLLVGGCDYVRKDAQLFHDENLDYYRKGITTAYGKAARAVKYGASYIHSAERLVEDAKDYAACFILSKRLRRRIQQIDALKISQAERDCILSKAKRYEDEAEVRAEKRAKALEVKHAQAISEWQSGTRRDLPHGIRKVYLRSQVQNSQGGYTYNHVQPSYGAAVPHDDARRLFRFTNHLRHIGWSSDSTESFDVGGFPLNRVNENGIVVGCHRIAWDEIDRFATQEGWVGA